MKISPELGGRAARTAMSTAISLALLSMAGMAHAQSNPAPAAAADDGQPRLEVVTVSANKRIERLEDVPMAISVIDDKALARSNAGSFTDLPDLSPALTISYGSVPSNNSINMRGIGTTSVGVGVEADVVVVIDDIPVGMQVMALQGLTDISRIEILKGPQSTLFGKSAVAGAINITTKPIAGPMTYTGSAMYTSDNEWRVAASASGRTSDKFGFRIAANSIGFPGVVRDLTQDNHTDGNKSRTFTGKFQWDLTDDLSLSLMPHYNHTVNACCVTPITSISNFAGAAVNGIPQLSAANVLAGIPIGPNNRYVRNMVFSGATSDDNGAGIKLNYTAPNGYVFSSITSADSYSQSDVQQDENTGVPVLLYYPDTSGKPAGVNLPYVQYGTTGVHSKTQEFRMASPDDSTFRYVAGLWYATNAIDRNFVRGYNGIPLTSPKEFFGSVYNRSKAIFGQATWDFMPNNSLIAGLRANRETSGYNIAIGNPPPGAFVQSAAFSSTGNDDNSVTGRVGLEHHFTKDVMGYATVSTGHKGKAYGITSGLTAAQAALNPVDAETSRNYEVGFKANLLNNRATVSVSVFNEKFKNYQQNSWQPIPGNTAGTTVLDSIGGVQSRGVEIDANVLATPQLILNGSLAYTEATISDWKLGPCYSLPNGAPNASCVIGNPAAGGTNTQDLSGAKMPNAPKLKFNLGGQYDIKLAEQPFDGFVTASYRFQSSVLFNINQDPNSAQGTYGITNLGFGIRERKDKYKLTFFVNNLFDKQYAVNSMLSTSGWGNGVSTTSWQPARDAFRYFGVRFDTKF
jgi:iron complex outermembrane receptor protein